VSLMLDGNVIAGDIRDSAVTMQSTCLAKGKNDQSARIWLLDCYRSHQYLELGPAQGLEAFVARSTSWTRTLSHRQQNG